MREVKRGRLFCSSSPPTSNTRPWLRRVRTTSPSQGQKRTNPRDPSCRHDCSTSQSQSHPHGYSSVKNIHADIEIHRPLHRPPTDLHLLAGRASRGKVAIFAAGQRLLRRPPTIRDGRKRRSGLHGGEKKWQLSFFPPSKICLAFLAGPDMYGIFFITEFV